MSFSTSSPERLQSSFLREMQFPGDSLNYCTELQVLAWVQEVSQSLSIHHFQFSRKSVAITSSCRPTFNSFTDANSFLESQQLPLTFKLFLVPVSSKTYRIFWGRCYSYKTKNTPHQPCFKILLIAHYSLQSPVFSRLQNVSSTTFTLISLLSSLIRNTRQGIESFYSSTSKENKNRQNAFIPRHEKY